MTDPKASILIVDDRPEKLLALEAVLEDLNQTIVRANSGREALRHVLQQDFAVILLDVNMPGMDGFETASLIRQRSNSRHTPIIFVTAFGDEMHAIRGYALGAVDYILAPVLPEVLRSKVAVFVDLFVKTEQIKRQAESLQRRAEQMQKLAAASLVINSALSVDQMLQTITDTARDIIGSHQAVGLYLPQVIPIRESKPIAVGSFSDEYVEWRDRELKLESIAPTLVAHSRGAIRLSNTALQSHPDWKLVNDADLPPLHGGVLAAPLSGRHGNNLGVIYLSGRCAGEFSPDDEAILVQLAQMGSIAIENTLYSAERQANRIKDEFLATLSHELRTPLNAILGWTQLLKLEKLDNETAHAVDVIDRNARSQTKLIEDLLDVSRITSGKLRLNKRQTNVSQVIQAAVDAARPSIDAKKIHLEVRLADEGAVSSIDPDRIQQVAWNLLSNAVKFTPDGGQVSVELSRTGPPNAQRLRLSVTDNGRGIEPKFLPLVFDRFRQADSTSTRGQGGLGIGLSIVHHLIEQHGGRVSAQSEGIGRGASFIVELPLVSIDSPIEKSSPADKAQPNSEPSPPTTLPPGLHILLVDDNPDARDVISSTLRTAGAEVTTAASVAEALKVLDSVTPNVLLSDIAMPDQDGYALIRQIRQRLRNGHAPLPAIALTAYARQEDHDTALSAGFNAHLTKPIDPPELLTRIAELTAASNPSSAPQLLA